MAELICEGCDEVIEDGHMDFNGEDWHEECFEVSDAPTYCCGQMYEEGESNCMSCGEPL